MKTVENTTDTLMDVSHRVQPDRSAGTGSNHQKDLRAMNIATKRKKMQQQTREAAVATS